MTVQVPLLPPPGRFDNSPATSSERRPRSASQLVRTVHRDLGETLIEVVITVVIIAISVTALVSSLATTGSAGQTQRNSVRSDTVLRNYAEAIETAVRSCRSGATYTVVFTPPPDFTVATAPTGTACPVPTSTQTLTLTVTGPSGFRDVMQIKVRTP